MQDKVRVGVVGTGFGSLVHIPGYQEIPGFEVVAVCAAPPDDPQSVAQRFGIPHAHTDYRDLVGLPDVDLVSIATPPFTHFEIAMAAIERGKHVLCEKPLALNVDEAAQMVRAVAEGGVVAVVDHEFRYHPARAEFRDLVRSGYIGRLHTVDFNVFSGGRASRDRPGWSWWDEGERGGGVLGAIISHWFDFLRWTFGDFAGVYGELDHFVGERLDASTGRYRAVTSDDSSAWIARLRSGAQVVGHFSSTAHFGGDPQTGAAPLRAFGSDGTLVLDRQDRLWGAQAGDSELRLLHRGDPEAPKETGKPGSGDASVLLLGFAPFKRMLTRVYDAIVTGAEVEPTFEDGLRVVELMEGIARSQAERRWIPLPLDSSGDFSGGIHR